MWIGELLWVHYNQNTESLLEHSPWAAIGLAFEEALASCILKVSYLKIQRGTQSSWCLVNTPCLVLSLSVLIESFALTKLRWRFLPHLVLLMEAVVLKRKL
jgi:hypothetical protein